jgi:uncharacterized protein (TIGR02270 family)
MIVSTVVQQHAHDAVIQALNRTALVESPAATLERLLRFDRRLAANLEGLRIAGQEGWALAEAGLENPSGGSLFVVAVRALEEHDATRVDRAIRIAQAVDASRDGLLASFEWVDSSCLKGTAAQLLRSADAFHRMVGVAACAMHRVDPGITAPQLHDGDRAFRARTLRAAGELGRRDMSPECAAVARSDRDEDVKFWAAWSAALLGDREAAVAALLDIAQSTSRYCDRALRLAIQTMSVAATREILQDQSSRAKTRRRMIPASGIAGDRAYVPWLLKQMDDPVTARIAGEAFALMTGVDLSGDSLDRPAPPDFDAGPTNDSADPDVEMDPDDNLTWPDVERIQDWWEKNTARFEKNTRYFMGAPISREHCLHVLKHGYQRQRILAAHYLCLLDPGTPLFNTSAPAWRQQKLLARL